MNAAYKAKFYGVRSWQQVQIPGGALLTFITFRIPRWFRSPIDREFCVVGKSLAEYTMNGFWVDTGEQDQEMWLACTQWYNTVRAEEAKRQK